MIQEAGTILSLGGSTEGCIRIKDRDRPSVKSGDIILISDSFLVFILYETSLLDIPLPHPISFLMMSREEIKVPVGFPAFFY